VNVSTTSRRRWARLLAGAVLIGYLATGIYSVQSDESAVSFVLGRAIGRDVLPGMHWNPPWPVGRVLVAKTQTSFTMPIGYRLLERSDVTPISDLWLTGDTNIVTARLDVQYSISSLTAYELRHERPTELIRQAGERALTRFLVGEQVDDVLTTRRQDLKQAVHREAQAMLDHEEVGIAIQSVNVGELNPPEQGAVRAAFQEIQSARADRERLIHEARAYRARTLAEAEGEAGRRISAARADRSRRTTLARGETERFLALAAEHARAPGVTEQRLYLETLERLLPAMETYVVEPGRDGTVNLRIIR
jgi:membrane protease subunit HflK